MQSPHVTPDLDRFIVIIIIYCDMHTDDAGSCDTHVKGQLQLCQHTILYYFSYFPSEETSFCCYPRLPQVLWLTSTPATVKAHRLGKMSKGVQIAEGPP